MGPGSPVNQTSRARSLGCSIRVTDSRSGQSLGKPFGPTTDFLGDCTTQLFGDYFINHEIRIPINQPCVIKVLALVIVKLPWVYCSRFPPRFQHQGTRIVHLIPNRW